MSLTMLSCYALFAFVLLGMENAEAQAPPAPGPSKLECLGDYVIDELTGKCAYLYAECPDAVTSNVTPFTESPDGTTGNVTAQSELPKGEGQQECPPYSSFDEEIAECVVFEEPEPPTAPPSPDLSRLENSTAIEQKESLPVIDSSWRVLQLIIGI
ncbi:MAG: hypothetical protein ACRD8W_05235 [Nitrososphaeraceae archaeon]